MVLVVGYGARPFTSCFLVQTLNHHFIYLTLVMLIEHHTEPFTLTHGTGSVTLKNGLDAILAEVIATATGKHGLLDDQETDGATILLSN